MDKTTVSLPPPQTPRFSLTPQHSIHYPPATPAYFTGPAATYHRYCLPRQCHRGYKAVCTVCMCNIVCVCCVHVCTCLYCVHVCTRLCCVHLCTRLCCVHVYTRLSSFFLYVVLVCVHGAHIKMSIGICMSVCECSYACLCVCQCAYLQVCKHVYISMSACVEL
jgi:hypothetical protein